MSGAGAAAWRVLEAALFASAEPIPLAGLAALLEDAAEAGPALAALAADYQGRGVELVETGAGWHFRTAADLAGVLARVVEKPRRLPRAAMEVLAVIAYHQPLTRAEIEEVRGTTLAAATMDLLLESGLIRPAGRRESPGRPTLWATTPRFLSEFGLADLRALPRLEELVSEGSEAGEAPG